MFRLLLTALVAVACSSTAQLRANVQGGTCMKAYAVALGRGSTAVAPGSGLRSRSFNTEEKCLACLGIEHPVAGDGTCSFCPSTVGSRAMALVRGQPNTGCFNDQGMGPALKHWMGLGERCIDVSGHSRLVSKEAECKSLYEREQKHELEEADTAKLNDDLELARLNGKDQATTLTWRRQGQRRFPGSKYKDANGHFTSTCESVSLYSYSRGDTQA